MDRIGTVAVESAPNGTGTLEAYTVAYDRESAPKGATIAGRLDESGLRFLAKVDREDIDTLHAVATGDPGGRAVVVTAGEQGNRFRFTR